MTGQPEPSHAELMEKLHKRIVSIGASELDVAKRFNRNGVAIGARGEQGELDVAKRFNRNGVAIGARDDQGDLASIIKHLAESGTDAQLDPDGEITGTDSGADDGSTEPSDDNGAPDDTTGDDTGSGAPPNSGSDDGTPPDTGNGGEDGGSTAPDSGSPSQEIGGDASANAVNRGRLSVAVTPTFADSLGLDIE